MYYYNKGSRLKCCTKMEKLRQNKFSGSPIRKKITFLRKYCFEFYRKVGFNQKLVQVSDEHFLSVVSGVYAINGLLLLQSPACDRRDNAHQQSHQLRHAEEHQNL